MQNDHPFLRPLLYMEFQPAFVNLQFLESQRLRGGSAECPADEARWLARSDAAMGLAVDVRVGL